MHAITSLRAIPRPRNSGLTPSIRRCASSGASSPALLGWIRSVELERRRPGDHSVDHGHEDGGYLGSLGDVGDPRHVGGLPGPFGSLEFAIRPGRCLPGRRELGLAHGADVDVLGHEQTLRDSTPVAGTAHRRGMDTEQPDAVDAEGSARRTVPSTREGAHRRSIRALPDGPSTVRVARRHLRPATGSHEGARPEEEPAAEPAAPARAHAPASQDGALMRYLEDGCPVYTATDLCDYLACGHLVSLKRRVASRRGHPVRSVRAQRGAGRPRRRPRAAVISTRCVRVD